MKQIKFLAIIIALFMTVGAVAQPTFTTVTDLTVKPYTNSFETMSQMWNTSNVYRNTITTSTIGSQLDTVNGAASTTIYLYPANWGAGSVNSDTFRQAPINGSGALSITYALLKGASNNPTVTVTAQTSITGVSGWAMIPGTTVHTVIPTSLTVDSSRVWEFATKYNKYYRLKITTPDTAVVQARYYFRPANR